MAKKRSRKRRRTRPPQQQQPASAATPLAEDDASRTRTARAKTADGPPPPLWGSFPLSELMVLIAIPMLIAGFFVGPPRGAYLLGVGLALGSLAGLELALREHFTGYRSHTLLLAGLPAVATLVGLVIATEVPPVACLIAAVAVMAGFAYLLANAFRKRSGGVLFRFRRLSG
jgi:hypothetical protein